MKLADFVTESGCRVRLLDQGRSLLLSLDMEQLGDGRHAEVELDALSAGTLQAALEDWMPTR